MLLQFDSPKHVSASHHTRRDPIHILACVFMQLMVVTGCSQSSPMTYDRYMKQANVEEYFDPVGASQIYSDDDQTRDGYDTWWKIDISKADFLALATAIAKKHHGPEPLSFVYQRAYPESWHVSDSQPSWWQLPTTGALQATSWCYAIGEAERHHGWALIYCKDAGSAWIWHWNHQWSSDECRSPTCKSNE